MVLTTTCLLSRNEILVGGYLTVYNDISVQYIVVLNNDGSMSKVQVAANDTVGAINF